MTPEALDKWKILPRLMMTALTVMSFRVVEWFMDLPDPSIQQSGLVSVCLGALTGAFAVWMGGESKSNSSNSNSSVKTETQMKA